MTAGLGVDNRSNIKGNYFLLIWQQVLGVTAGLGDESRFVGVTAGLWVIGGLIFRATFLRRNDSMSVRG